MKDHVMTAESALGVLGALAARGVAACVGGGWAVDALLGEQTREHSDLGLWILASEAEPLFTALGDVGLDRIFPWPGDRPWNFVVHDGGALRLDLHFYERTERDMIHYGPFDGDELFPAAALAGRGTIGGTAIRCETPEWALRWHSGYPVRAVDRHDVSLLCERFALELPADHQQAAEQDGPGAAGI